MKAWFPVVSERQMSPTVGVCLAVILFSVIFFSKRRSKRFPPGPKGQPIIGILNEHPKSHFWRTYAQWGREYAPGNGTISFQVLGTRTVVINTRKAAEELLVKRSALYSDRPYPPMAGTLMNTEKSMFFIPYNERFKFYRKLLHKELNPVAAMKHWGILENDAKILAAKSDKEPEKLVSHLNRYSAALTMDIAYGYKVIDGNDRFIKLAEETLAGAALALSPGWVVDSIPILQYIPEWFPGAAFKTKAKHWGKLAERQVLGPFEWVTEEIAKGTWKPSFTSRLLEDPNPRLPLEEYRDRVAYAAGSLYSAGSDTISASLQTFVFNMMRYPEMQARAQAEVDGVTAKEHRLPTLQDRSSMPYLEAILKEVLRYSSPVPMSLFHATAVDNIYNGYNIPAKANIIPNIWGMLNDAKDYPDPSKFDPERFLGKDGKAIQYNPLDIVFGFGRRGCPGQHIGEAAIFIAMATMLAVLDIKKGLDKEGREIEPNVEFTSGIVTHIVLPPYRLTRRATRTDVGVLLRDADII